MNIELIKKYKKEFDHILHGGKIIGKKSLKDKKLESLRIEVFECKEDWEVILIDNEYSEFSKALAEGKTIQWEYQEDEWVDLPADFEFNEQSMSYEVEEYRIKQEEPQLKAGDFVRVGCDGDSPKTIKIFHKESIDEPPYVYIMKDGTKWDKCIKWDPSYKELCWFTTRAAMLDGVNYAVLGYFNTIIGLDYTTTHGDTFRHCEPFINSKPSWFKD